MQRRRFLGSAALAVLPASFAARASAPAIHVHKGPGCDCCNAWIEHLRASGFAVTADDRGNNAARAKAGIPAHLGSCHTGMIAGYAIEGHVPAADIKRLLAERPKAVGLAVPGMPVGSPGMEIGSRRDPYEVLLVRADGTTAVYAKY
jgi:hypothetical protein